jgi:imidazoleglycerol phosphate synthase glutamine amidotransferase subunit HisH
MKSRYNCHKFKIIQKLFETGPSSHMFAFVLNAVKYLEYNFPQLCKIVLKQKKVPSISWSNVRSNKLTKKVQSGFDTKSHRFSHTYLILGHVCENVSHYVLWNQSNSRIRCRHTVC